MVKTDKSSLQHKLEEHQSCLTPDNLPSITASVIDGGYLLHSVLSKVTKRSSFGDIARTLLANVSKYRGKQVHVVFNTYRESSLKDAERERRKKDEADYVITGADQSPRSSPSKLLRNSSFKDQLAKFLTIEWKKEHYCSYLNGKEIFVSYGGDCTRFYATQNNIVVFDKPAMFQGYHE